MTEKEEIDMLRRLLGDCRIILSNMAMENKRSLNPFKQRWPIHHEPLRSDAKYLIKRIDPILYPEIPNKQ